MALFRVDVSRETGEVVLLIATNCGFKPVMGWPSTDGLKEFAEMLLDIYHRRSRGQDRVMEISENILKQALDEDSQA